MTSLPEPTSCDRCSAKIDGAYTQRWRDDVLIETFCGRCNDAEHVANYVATGIITSHLTLIASLASVRGNGGYEHEPKQKTLADVWHSMRKLRQHIKDFERDVWFGGLQSAVKACPVKGMRMDFDGGRALNWTMCGRSMTTIETPDEDAQVSVMCAEDGGESTTGLRGIRATEEQAIALLEAARKAFLGGARFAADSKVSYL